MGPGEGLDAAAPPRRGIHPAREADLKCPYGITTNPSAHFLSGVLSGAYLRLLSHERASANR